MTAKIKKADKQQVEDNGNEKFSLLIVVHVITGDEFKVTLESTKEDLLLITQTINTTMDTVKQNNSLSLPGKDGTVYHFNTDHVVCVETRLG